MLAETDAPYLTPVPRRGKPNSPAMTAYTVRYLAALKAMDLSDFCAQLQATGEPWRPVSSAGERRRAGRVRLLGAGDVRDIAGQARRAARPRSSGRTSSSSRARVRQIAALAGCGPGDVCWRSARDFGSLTLALLAAMPPRGGSTATRLVAVEIDPVLAAELPKTIAERAPDLADRVDGAHRRRARDGRARHRDTAPTVLAANLPYNVAVPVVLHLLAALPSLLRGVVMVQAEVADRMCAAPGSRVYGVPSAKLAWYAAARLRPDGPAQRLLAGPERGLQARRVHPPRPAARPRPAASEVFAVIDAAFGQRRKTLRAALAAWAGSPRAGGAAIRARPGVDPGLPAARPWRSRTSPASPRPSGSDTVQGLRVLHR